MTHIKLALEPGFYIYYQKTEALAHVHRFATRAEAQARMERWNWQGYMHVIEVPAQSHTSSDHSASDGSEISDTEDKV